MAKINMNDYGTKRAKLEPKDIDGDIALVTIDTADSIEVDDEESATGKRNTLVLTFVESGEKAHWLNYSQIEALVTLLGEDTDEWLGKVVPVEVADVKYKGQTFRKVRVMAAEQWESVFKEAGESYPYRSIAQERKVSKPLPAASKAKGGKRK